MPLGYTNEFSIDLANVHFSLVHLAYLMVKTKETTIIKSISITVTNAINIFNGNVLYI